MKILTLLSNITKHPKTSLAILLVVSWAFFFLYLNYTKPEIETKIETVTKTEVDTMYVHVDNYIRTKADTIYITKTIKENAIVSDTTAYFRYFPKHELLSGWVDITYTYSDTTFTIKDNQEIKQITNNIETIRTITKAQMIKPFWIRPKIGLGWYGSKTDGIGQGSFGVILFDTVSVNASALTSGQLGLFVEYIF